jgi:two-component system phosphate regulon response regulator PhoB
MPETVLALLADRDADTRLMYAEYLRQLTYEIDEAEDGPEALAKAISRRPSVIVTDSRLPGMSGLELCRLLRNDASTRPIPIIVVTGDAFASDATLAEAAGADAVLVKPYLPERLAAEISRVLSQSHELRARGRAVHGKVAVQVARSNELIARSRGKGQPVTLSRAHERRDTTLPPTPPPTLVCPGCDRPLRYVRSHIGGVSERHREQWDYFECARGCGTFQYRQRTRKIRRVG